MKRNNWLTIDPLYVTRRNRLIPAAEKHANTLAGARPKREKDMELWAAKWNAIFHSKMNELARGIYG